MSYHTLDDYDFSGKRVMVRVDFNVPMEDGKVTDATRLERALPTIQELSEKGAKVILLSHFGRPQGSHVKEMSLQPVTPVLSDLLDKGVSFAGECIGPIATSAVNAMKDGDILLLENTRFHTEEEKNDPAFAKELAANADIFVNDAFSAAHRAHGSTAGIATLVPSAAGRAMERELDYLNSALANPTRPMMAVVGGAKVSSKLDVLTNLIDKADVLVVGGGMANTFMLAMGLPVGKSLAEPDLADTAREIMSKAAKANCEILLPKDIVVTTEFKPNAAHTVREIDGAKENEMILDLGPNTVDYIAEKLDQMKTLIWNGPLGAFEMKPFDTATVEAARYAGKLSEQGKLIAVAGGGDTVAALNQAGASDKFTYISTAGGAFLEWMEGKVLPGVEALRK